MKRVAVPGRPSAVAHSDAKRPLIPIPIDLLGEAHDRVLHVDDLIQTGPKKIVRMALFALSRSHHKPLLARLRRHHKTTKNEIPNRKKPSLNTAFPCDRNYFKQPGKPPNSTDSKFFTDDQLLTDDVISFQVQDQRHFGNDRNGPGSRVVKLYDVPGPFF